MQKRNSFNNGNNSIPNDLNSVDLSNNSSHMNQQQQQQTTQNASAPGMMPWANPVPGGVGGGGMYDSSGYPQAPGFDGGQFGQHGMPRWDPKMNPAALAAQQYQQMQQHQQQQQQQQLTNAIRQKHAAQRPAPYATSRQMHQQQQQQQDMRHLGKPTKSSDALVGQPGYPMPSPMGEHMMMANGMPPNGGQFPPNFRYMPPQQQQQPGQAPYHPHHPPHLQPPMPFPGHQTMTKQPSGLSLRASEASSTPPPPQAPVMPVPPRPQSSSVVESNLSGMSHSSSLQGLSEQQQQEATGGGGGGGANPTPPITPKLNILTPNPQEPTPMGPYDQLRLSTPVIAGDLVPPFRIPPNNNNYMAVQFQLSQEHHAALMLRHDLELYLRAFRVLQHLEPERLLEESRNAVCAFPVGLTVHANQVFVRTLVPGEPLNQPISLRKHVRVGTNFVQLQLVNPTENILQYYFVVEFVHRSHIKAMIEQTIAHRTVPYAQAIMSLKSWIRQTPSAGLVINLTDLVNPERLIVLPVRGRDVCQHPECFDLESFLVHNARTERTLSRNDRWRCPFCGKPLRDLEVDDFLRQVINEAIKINPHYNMDKSMQIHMPNYVDEIVFDADARFRFRRSPMQRPPVYYHHQHHQAPAGAIPPHYLQQQQQQQQAQIYQMMAANEAAKKHLSDASPNMKSPSGQPPPPSASPSFNPGAGAPGPFYFNNAMKPHGPAGGNVPMVGKPPPGMYPQQFMPGQGGYPAYPMDNSVQRPPSQPGLQPQYYNGNNPGQMKPNGMPMPSAGKQPPFHPMYSQQGPPYMAQPYSPAGGFAQAPPDQSQISRPPSTSNPGAYAAQQQQQQQQSEAKQGGNFAGANQGLPNSNSHMEQLNYANSPISNPGTPASTLSSSASSNNMLGHLSSEQQQLQYQQQQAFSQQQMIKNALNNAHQPLTPQSQAQSIYSNPSVSQPSTPSPTTPKHINSAGPYDGNNQTLLQSQQQQQQQQMSSGEKSSKSPASAGHVIDLTATEQTIQDANEATVTAQEAAKEQAGEATGEEDEEDGGDSDSESTSSLENSVRSNYEAAESGAVSKAEEPEEKDILSEALMTSGVQDETGVGLLDNSVSAAPETTATAAGADETASSDTLNHSAVVAGGDQLPGLNPVDVESIIGGFQMDETYELLFQGLEPITDAEAKGLASRGDFFPTFSNEELAAYLPGSDSGSGGAGGSVQADASAISNITEIQNGLLKSVVSLNTGYKELYTHVELTSTVQHHHHLQQQQQS